MIPEIAHAFCLHHLPPLSRRSRRKDQLENEINTLCTTSRQCLRHASNRDGCSAVTSIASASTCKDNGNTLAWRVSVLGKCPREAYETAPVLVKGVRRLTLRFGSALHPRPPHDFLTNRWRVSAVVDAPGGMRLAFCSSLNNVLKNAMGGGAVGG